MREVERSWARDARANGRGGMTLRELAERIGARVVGDESRVISGCAGLDDARPDHVTFLANPRYAGKLATTRAAAAVVAADDETRACNGLSLLVARDPYFAFRQAVVALHGFRRHPPPGVHATAVIEPGADVDPSCAVQAFCYVAAGARIGPRCVLYPGCYVGEGAVLGEECVLHPHVAVYDGCVLGSRVVLHAGCVIGQDGFGYATHGGAHHKIPQAGRVVVEDDVEMGACCAIDRATVGDTVVRRGTKFSNHVVIGHGADIGPHNLLVEQVGVAGSTKTGAYVVLGGQAGVAGHLRIGDGAQVAAKAGVMTDLAPRGLYGGVPAVPLAQAKRQLAASLRLPALVAELKRLRARVDALEKERGAVG